MKKKYGFTRVATSVATSLASIAVVACSGGGGGSFGIGDGGVRTAESSCDVVIKWLNGCKLTVDRAACVKEASTYSANQLAASEECVNRSDCDKKGFQQCMERVIASEPATATATNTTADGGAPQSTSPPAETDPAPTATTGSSAACTSCMTAKCAKQAQACQASAACKSLASCVAQAGDASQRAQCETDFGGGVGLYNGLMQCAQSSCGAECTY